AYRKRVANCLDDLIRSQNVDIVEFPEYGVESLCWHTGPRKIPMIIRWHTPIGKQFKIKHIIYYPIRRWINALTKDTVQSSDAMTFPSKWMLDRVKEKMAFNNYHQIIPNGINSSDWEVNSDELSEKQENDS
ncbi:MAG: glycosyltransferase family 4 protein, partial [Candidatus Hodarchaeota archaeon]